MRTKLPTITFVYDRYNKSSNTQRASVEIRITYQRKQKYISTGIMIYPNQWNNNIIVNTPDATILNQILDKLLVDIRKIIYDMIQENCIDIFSIPNRLKVSENSKITFMEYCKRRAVIRKYGKAEDTQERYDRFLRLLEEYGKIKYFEDITEEKIISYDKFLIKKDLKPYSKWNNYHRFLNSFIIDAVDEGLLSRNPYKWVNIDKKNKDATERYLTPEEFYRIKSTKMPTECLERVRDVFIFQTYTCLSYSDLKKFNAKDAIEVNEVKTYLGDRTKTRKDFTIPLLEPALDILNKYNRELPVISNTKYNLYLKAVASIASVDRPVSTHWARHTGATLMLNEGLDLKMIAKICGHSSTRITEKIYAKLLNRTVVNAVSDIKDNIIKPPHLKKK